MSTGLVAIGFYSRAHYYYTSISTWASSLLIILGFVLFIIGLYGYDAINKMKTKNIKIHIILLSICFILLIIACVGFFYIATSVNEAITKNWNIVHKSLEDQGYNVRRSFLINQIVINLKFAGFFSAVFVAFILISLSTSIHQLNLTHGINEDPKIDNNIKYSVNNDNNNKSVKPDSVNVYYSSDN